MVGKVAIRTTGPAWGGTDLLDLLAEGIGYGGHHPAFVDLIAQAHLEVGDAGPLGADHRHRADDQPGAEFLDIAGQHGEVVQHVVNAAQAALDFFVVDPAAFADFDSEGGDAALGQNRVRVLVADVHAFVVGQDEVGAEGLGQHLGLGHHVPAARRRQEGEGGVSAACRRCVNVDHVIGMTHQPVEQGVRDEGRRVAVRIAGERGPRIVRALIHRGFEHVADEVAVLYLEGQRVLHRHHDKGAAERIGVDFVDQAADHLDAEDLVSVKGGAEIKDRPRLRAAHHFDRQLHPGAVDQLDRGQALARPLSARQLKSLNFKINVRFESFVHFVRCRPSPNARCRARPAFVL